MSRNEIIQLRLTREEKDLCKSRAKKSNLTVSDVIRELLNNWIKTGKLKNDEEET